MCAKIKQIADEARAIQNKNCMDAALDEIGRLCKQQMEAESNTETVAYVSAKAPRAAKKKGGE